MSAIEEKAVALLDKFESLATQYTPEVISGAKSAVIVTAIGDLINGLVGMASVYVIYRITKSLTTFFVEKKEKDGYYSNWEIGFVLSSIIGMCVCVCISLVTVWELFDVWNYVAIFNPKLALAHRILGL